MTEQEQADCEQCCRRLNALLDGLKQDMAGLGDKLHIMEKQGNFLAWENVQLKQQLAALRGGQP